MAQTMRAARLHAVGEPMRIDQVERPVATGTDVVVHVKACGMVPNLANVLANWETWYPQMPLPPRPAIHGLDPSGVIHQVGDKVVSLKPGDRVYVNPGRFCGACHECSSGRPQACGHWTLGGYFGYNSKSMEMFERYPYGGFCEFMLAPQAQVIKIPDNMTFVQGSRMGYLGTSYAALKKCGPLMGRSLIINGASGTLGVGATLFALAMGIGKIYAIARGEELLSRLKALAPDRIETFSNRTGSSAAFVRARTDGIGADLMLDTLGAKAPLESMLDAMKGVRRGGRIVNIGGTSGDLPVDVKWWMDEQMELIGSVWFTAAEGMEVAGMVKTGVIDLSVMEPMVWPLENINEAISGVASGDGGFTYYAVET
ncbi:alcohol dehydrogenase catalytic domain-containing protein [Microvirga zambiensis]|uniref:alcohol dehydrogenase catalytic domain-containing protein n=1 Tax=Microvirga zambiensis TaxID=1402137 RepID=UPI00191F3BA8|nr:alcohol dehydrogenase catalytic domain-containing protein [Microvirga zambiensis]